MKYMLITVIEREIFTEIFPTHREAREKMITEMKEYGAEIPNECSEKEYECDDEFGFSEWSAYLNDGNNHDNYDWLIVAL